MGWGLHFAGESLAAREERSIWNRVAEEPAFPSTFLPSTNDEGAELDLLYQRPGSVAILDADSTFLEALETALPRSTIVPVNS